MKTPALLIVSSVTVALFTGSGWAAHEGRMPIDRDITYEQNLRWENSADKSVTPAKVIRWMRNKHGHQTSAPANTEFVPIVNAHDGHVRLVAAFAYKF